LTDALAKGVDIQTLEALIKLKNDEEARLARQLFEERFAMMQKDFVAVGKTSYALDDNGKVLYAFCPLENILRAYAPILAKHGFSFSWNEEMIQGKENEKRVYCHISGFGHTKTTSMDIPVPATNRMTNAVQVRAAATTYGKRYTFIAAVGVIIGGEDDDSRILPIEPVSDEKMRKVEERNDLKINQLAANKLLKDMNASEKFTVDEMEGFKDAALAMESEAIGLGNLVKEYQKKLDERSAKK
jgi:hypothetical protein